MCYWGEQSSTGAWAAASVVLLEQNHASCAVCQGPLSRKQITYSKDCEESTARSWGDLQELICNHSLNQDVPVTASCSSVSARDTCLQAIGRAQAVTLNQMMLVVSRKTGVKMSNLFSFGVLSPGRGQQGLQEVV